MMMSRIKFAARRVAVAAAFMTVAGGAGSAMACGSEPFYGEICTFAFNYCPENFLPADGRVLPIAQYQALYSLLMNTYGGDGKTNFALPDLRGRAAVGVNPGGAPGATPLRLGQQRGTETVTLSPANVPQTPVTVAAGTGATVAAVGGPVAQPVPTIPPELALTVCIATTGYYPTRPD